jgi:hypothetical protein
MVSFGAFVHNHRRLDSLIDLEDLDLLATIGLLDRRLFNDRKILYFRDGWSLRWTLILPIPMLDQGVLEYQLAYQGRELSSILYPELLDAKLSNLRLNVDLVPYWRLLIG